MKQTIDKQIYLREVDLFQDLTSEEIDALSERTPLKVVPAKTVFYSPQDATEVLFLIKKGRVRLYQLSATGKIFTTATLESGTFFGEMALLGQAVYGNYAEAITPCMLCLMRRDDVAKMLLNDPRISLRVVEALGKRLSEVERRLTDFALKPVSTRLAGLLVQLADKQTVHYRERQNGNSPSAQPIEITCTHEELAQIAGVQRETITRMLKDLQSTGLIELYRGRILLQNLENLRELSIQ